MRDWLAAQVASLLKAQPSAPVSTYDIEQDCARLLSTGLFQAVRPALNRPGAYSWAGAGCGHPSCSLRGCPQATRSAAVAGVPPRRAQHPVLVWTQTAAQAGGLGRPSSRPTAGSCCPASRPPAWSTAWRLASSPALWASPCAWTAPWPAGPCQRVPPTRCAAWCWRRPRAMLERCRSAAG